MKIVKVLRFRKERLDPELRRKLEDAARELSSLSGERYDLAQALFGRCIVARARGVVIGGVVTNTRPCRTSIVAIDEKQGTLLPSLRENDFTHLRRKLGLSSEAAVAELKGLVSPAEHYQR